MSGWYVMLDDNGDLHLTPKCAGSEIEGNHFSLNGHWIFFHEHPRADVPDHIPARWESEQ